jgi:hypothetical protein
LDRDGAAGNAGVGETLDAPCFRKAVRRFLRSTILHITLSPCEWWNSRAKSEKAPPRLLN